MPFRRRWAEAERRVCCIEIESSGGTGFLIGPDLVLTSGHVVKPWGRGRPFPRRKVVLRFDFQRPEAKTAGGSVAGDTVGRVVELAGTSGDDTSYLVAHRFASPFDAGDQGGLPGSEELDYAILRLAEPVGADGRGWFDLEDTEPPLDDAFLSVLQHPGLGLLSFAFENLGVLRLNDNQTRLRHRVNTQGGSSGSPCFDLGWNVVAVHQAGDPEASVDHLAEFNQAIPIALIRRDLDSQHPSLLAPRTATEPVDRDPKPPGLEFDPRSQSIVLCFESDEGGSEIEALEIGLRERGFEVCREITDFGAQPATGSGSSKDPCLLFVETPNAWRSRAIKKKLLWGRARGVAVAVVQQGAIERRAGLAGSLPAESLDPEQPIESQLDRITAWIEQRVLQARSRRAGLALTVQSILEGHPAAQGAELSPMAEDLSIATFEVDAPWGSVQKRLLFRWIPERPTVSLVNDLVDLHDRYEVVASVLVFEEPEEPLVEEEERLFGRLVGERPIRWSERHHMSEVIYQLIDQLTS